MEMFAFFVVVSVNLLVTDGLLFSTKCMGELGCFSNGPPFFDLLRRPVSVLPEDREKINTTFELYTPAEPSSAVILSNIYHGRDYFSQQDIQSTRKTVFIIHGYRGKYYMDFIRRLKDVLFEKGENLNIFVVNYSGGDDFRYEQTVANLRVVGAETALLIQTIQEVKGLDPKNVHIIGLSLGAHAAGYAGKRLKKSTRIGRITGASPAGPFFTGTSPEVRLDAEDADLVDCIHSDGNSLLTGGFGTPQKICQLNFYPNGGKNQPGCPRESIILISLWLLKITASEDDRATCSHNRSFQLLIESVRNRDNPLYATVCDSYEDFKQSKCGNCDNRNRDSICIPLGYYADQSLPKNLPSNASLYVDTA